MDLKSWNCYLEELVGIVASLLALRPFTEYGVFPKRETDTAWDPAKRKASLSGAGLAEPSAAR